MTLPSPEWFIVVGTALLATVTVPLYLQRMSSRRLQRLKRRDDDLFDELVEAPEEHAEDYTKQAREQIKVFDRGLKRISIFAFGLLFIVIAAVPYFSALPAAFVSAFLGAITLVIGIAAKPAIENFISGVVLAFSNTIHIGDTVLIDDKQYGTIEDLGYTHSVLKTWDFKRYIVPNSEMLGKCFLNYSLHDNFLHAYVEFRVAPDTDLDLVERLCTEEPKKSKFFANYEDPALWVMDMDKDSILCWCGAWADSPSDAWMLKSDIRNSLLRAFQREGISTQSVRLVHEPVKGPLSAFTSEKA